MQKYLIETLKKWPIFILCPLSGALWIIISDYFSGNATSSYFQVINMFAELFFAGFSVLAPLLLIVFFPIQVYIDQKMKRLNFPISLIISILLGVLITFIWLVKLKKFSFSLSLMFRFPETFIPMFIVSIVFSILWSKLREK